MTQYGHTPGPWCTGKAVFDRENGAALEGEVARVFMPGPIEALVVGLGADEAQIDATANLIAAAPELLDSARELENIVYELCRAYNHPLPNATLDRSDKAIYKAMGVHT